MLTVETFTLGPLATNAYLLTNEDGKGIVIDPGMEPHALLKRIESIDIEAVILTHAHFDHIGGVEEVRKLKQCPVYVHAAEADWLTDPGKNGSLRWPELGGAIQCAPAEVELQHGQQLTLLGHNFTVYHTPGHSPGSVSFLYENKLFSGDVLFMMSVGRTDLPGGSSRELYASIHDIVFKLEAETEVYPGHGPATTVGYEREHNPYV